jgi:AcrR family transcriptional regulator
MNNAAGDGNDAGTAEALLDAARPLFARAGYAGTSVRAITAAAGANLGAITYHYGSKRELYERVLEQLLVPLADRIEAVVAGGGSVLDRVGAVVRAYFDYLAEQPDVPRLLLQELSMGSGPGDVVARPLKRVHGALTALIAAGQEAGEVRPGPRLVLSVFILSVPVHLAILQQPLRRHVGVDLLDPDTRDRVTAAAVEFVRDGLKSAAPKVEA